MVWFLVAILAGYGLYLYGKSRESEKQRVEIGERVDYFGEKNQKQIDLINDYFKRMNDLHKLTLDMIILQIVQKLADEDRDRWDRIIESSKSKATQERDEFEEWISETKDVVIQKLSKMRTLLTSCNNTYLELFNIYHKALSKLSTDNSMQKLEFFLDDLLDSSIYYEAYFSDVSGKSKLSMRKISSKNIAGITKRTEELLAKLADILKESKARYFGW